MDIEARKYYFIQELFKIEDENIISELEQVLLKDRKNEKEISNGHISTLDKRFKEFSENAETLSWKDVKQEW